MAGLLDLVGFVCGVVSLVCWVIVLIKIFHRSIALGIVGVICGLVAFVWGWMKAAELGLTKVMLTWTGTMVVSIVISVVRTASAVEEVAPPVGP